MTKFFVYLGLAFTFATAACGSKQTRFEGGATATNGAGEKSVSASLNWVKNKSKTIDAEVRIVNNTDAGIRLYASDMTLNFGGETLAARGADQRLSTGVRTQMVLIFPFGEEKPKHGPAVLTITPHDLADKAMAPIKINFVVEAAR